jgi:uncharacterized membrane protein
MEPEHKNSSSVISKGRLEFLFDGIFAIAMTILVLELKVPELVDRRSLVELARALAHHAPTFVSYLLSFAMLGMFWYRHNHQYHHFHKITEGMLVLHFVQLAAAAFFPFCAALLGRYHSNLLSIVIYLGCVLVYMWAMFANWIVAKRCDALGAEFTAEDYLRIRTKGLRGCLIISILFAGVVIEALVRR